LQHPCVAERRGDAGRLENLLVVPPPVNNLPVKIARRLLA